MIVFVDTSAIFALMIEEDRSHAEAVRVWDARILKSECRLITSNYVVAETYDLIRRRFGVAAMSRTDAFVRDYFEITFVTRDQHERARANLFAKSERKLSLVDCVSFIVARDEGADAIFAYDRHFEAESFVLL